MKKIILPIAIVLLISGCNFNAPNQVENETITQSSVQEILDLAYIDELKAESIYQYVIQEFGNQRPFTNIVQAEAKHSQTILNLYSQFNLEPPQATTFSAPKFTSLQDACQKAAAAEELNIAMYDDLLEQTKEESIISVFQNLRNASLQNHLPAFKRCS